MASVTQPPTEVPSAQEWKDLLEEVLPHQGNWTEEEYLVLTDHRTRLVEFTDGFLEVLPMPTDKHQGILQGSVETMPRPVYRNTGSSTRKRKPLPSSTCAEMFMKKPASTGVGNRRRRFCCHVFPSPSRRFSTRIE